MSTVYFSNFASHVQIINQAGFNYTLLPLFQWNDGKLSLAILVYRRLQLISNSIWTCAGANDVTLRAFLECQLEVIYKYVKNI